MLNSKKNCIFVEKTNMPKIYEYFGLIFFFGSNEHDPVHVHIKKKGGGEIKAEFTIKNGSVEKIEFKTIEGKNPLSPSDWKTAERFVVVKQELIVARWIDHIVLHKKVKSITITKRI